jgi:hypothetical protein
MLKELQTIGSDIFTDLCAAEASADLAAADQAALLGRLLRVKAQLDLSAEAAEPYIGRAELALQASCQSRRGLIDLHRQFAELKEAGPLRELSVGGGYYKGRLATAIELMVGRLRLVPNGEQQAA